MRCPFRKAAVTIRFRGSSRATERQNGYGRASCLWAVMSVGWSTSHESARYYRFQPDADYDLLKSHAAFASERNIESGALIACMASLKQAFSHLLPASNERKQRMPCVLITPEAFRHVEGRHTDILKEAGFQIAYPKNPEFTRGLCAEKECIDELSVADALIAGSEYVTASMLDRLPRMRVIARSGVGYDRIDVPAATERNVLVTITPTAVHEAAAEHALALLFAISKNVVGGDRATRAGQWPRTLIEPIRGKTIGILGLGRIGRSMAIRSAALGMTVIAHDPFPNEAFARENDIELVDFDTLVERCDILTIHCPFSFSFLNYLSALKDHSRQIGKQSSSHLERKNLLTRVQQFY